jgi:hypothetical protein
VRNAGIGAAILLVGIAVGYSLRGTPESSPQAPPPVHADQESADGRRLRDIQEKLARFSTQDLEDYVRLKNLEEKYKKADELVGKMILILLADVGIRVSMEQERFAKNPPKAEPARRPVPSPVAKPAERPAWSLAETRLRQAWGANPEYLRTVRIPNFGDELSSLHSMQTFDPAMNGCYDGDARLESGRHWQVHMALNVRARDGAIVGQSLVELSEDGNVFSRSAHDGNQQSFLSAPGSSGIFLEVSDTIYLQLYPLGSGEVLAGNIYTKDRPSKFTFKGTTILGRQSCPK